LRKSAKPSEDLELLNLLAAPKRSRLHSLAKAMIRIETLGFVLAWTKVRNNTASASSVHGEPALGCPPIDLVELPRLKLAFTMRADFNGDLRLYSLDHSDLFVTNERHPAVSKMIQGIPHSLLLSNLKGELQVLVPVISPPRPSVDSQPFTTLLVLDRSNKKWTDALSSR